MSWTKIGDEFPAAARDLSDAAFRVHVEALCWSNYRKLDQLIPKREVRRFAETADPDTAVEELVAAGWWQDCDDGGWYIGCRFPEWQLERSVIEHRHKLNADRQRRHRMHKAGDHSLCRDPDACVTRYETRDRTRDPGRVGSGRERRTTSLEEEDEPRRRAARPRAGRQRHDGRRLLRRPHVSAVQTAERARPDRRPVSRAVRVPNRAC